jgi:glycosyltransferase involved in cell wall biosynthesis
VKNILIINWGRKAASTTITYFFIKSLIKNFNVFHSISKESDYYNETQNLNSSFINISTYHGKLSFMINSLFFYFKGKKKIINYVKEKKIKVVIFPMFHIWNFFILKELNNLNIKTIFCNHDANLHPGEKSLFINFLLKFMINNSKAHIVFSNHVCNQINKIVFPRKISIKKLSLPPLVNIEYEKKIKSLENNKISLLFFGRLLKYKGIELLLDSIIQIQERINIHLTIAGSGNLATYHKKIDKIHNIRIYNTWLNDNDIIKLFDTNDICILPYLESSQSGVVPVSFMTGTPIIATSVGGLKEQITNNYNGIVVEKNIKSITEAIFNIYNNKKIYNKFSIACHDTFDSKFSFKNFKSEIINYVDELSVN